MWDSGEVGDGNRGSNVAAFDLILLVSVFVDVGLDIVRKMQRGKRVVQL